MTTRDDVYAVLVLLTELERTLFPGRDPGDSGGYTVDPGVPPPLPPTGVPGGWSADARGGPVAFDAWVGRAPGPAPYRASAERPSPSVAAPVGEPGRAVTPAPAAPGPAAGTTPGLPPVHGSPTLPPEPGRPAEPHLPSLPDAPAAPARRADAHRLPPPGRAPTSESVTAGAAAGRPRRPAPDVPASGDRPAAGSPSDVVASHVPLPGAREASPHDDAPSPPGQPSASLRRRGRPPTRPGAEAREASGDHRPTAPPPSPRAPGGRTLPPRPAEVGPTRRAPTPGPRRRGRRPSRPPDPRHAPTHRLPLGSPSIDLMAPAVAAAVPGLAPRPPDEPPPSPTAPPGWSPVRRARTVQVGRRAVRLTALQAVRAHRAVTVGYLDRVLRRLS